jgi:hypothetical protein
MLGADEWTQDILVWLGIVSSVIVTAGLVRVKVVKPIIVFADEMRKALAFVNAELRNNGGKTIRDVADRIDRHVAGTETRIARLEHLAQRHEADLAQAARKAEQATWVVAQHAEQELARYAQIVDLIANRNAEGDPR